MNKLEKIIWPVLSGTGVDCLRNLLDSLIQLEKLSEYELSTQQLHQFNILFHYFNTHSMGYKNKILMTGVNFEEFSTWDQFRLLPILTRAELQSDINLKCEPPSSHLPIDKTATSGSSGVPVIVDKTMVSQLFWMAYTLREHVWWKRDFSGSLLSFRANLPSEKIVLDNWGPPVNYFFKTGKAYGASLKLNIIDQVTHIVQVNPTYLITYPSTLESILDYFLEESNGAKKLNNLNHIRTVGEVVSDSLRDKTHKILGKQIVDLYSSQEVGVIATQCPVSGLYHVSSENLIVEVINEENQPCQEGEIGQVVITDLHNFATPLIRYAIEDYAQLGGQCICGKKGVTLKKIWGRKRNLVTYPDGSKRWPLVGFARFREIAPIVQYQLIQINKNTIQLNLVVERTLSQAEEEMMKELICTSLGHVFLVDVVYFSQKISISKNCKFEEFISLI